MTALALFTLPMTFTLLLAVVAAADQPPAHRAVDVFFALVTVAGWILTFRSYTKRVHAQGRLEEVRRLTDEIDKLRSWLARSNMPCIYCGLASTDTSRCASGFPGCGRMDDLMLAEDAD